MYQFVKRMAVAALGATILAVGMASAPPAQARAGLTIFAPLSGPAIGGVAPIARGRYRDRSGDRDFTLQLFNANIPNYTMCTAWLNGTPILQARVFAGIAIFPAPHTVFGDVVPVANAGDELTITAAGIGPIATGTFGGGAPALPLPVIDMAATLDGPAINGLVPTGSAGYTVFAGLNNQNYRLFACEALGVNLPVGSRLDVYLVPASGRTQRVGTMILDALHNGRFERSDAMGVPPPAMSSGDVIRVVAGGQIILSGPLN
jgi:hypothetical protein